MVDSERTVSNAVVADPPRTWALRVWTPMLLALLLAMGCWIESRALRSLKSRHAAQSASLVAMQDDLSRIQQLTAAPRWADEQRKSSEELLAQIEAALNEAGVPLDRWQDSTPQPPRKLPDQDYTQISTRVFLEKVSLQGIASLGYHLVTRDPSLQITGIRLTAGRAVSTWDIELTVSYLIYG